MDVKVLVAVISAAVTIVGALIAVWSNIKVTRVKHALDVELRRGEREFEAKSALDLYRRPLLAAAVELSRRIGNIRANHFLNYLSKEDRRAEVALKSTLYRFAAFLGWRELLYRRLTYLSYEDNDRTRSAVKALENVSTQLASSWLAEDDGAVRFMLWKDEQRAIGGLMLSGEQGTSISVRGFEDFTNQYSVMFESWMSSFASDLGVEFVEYSPRLREVGVALENLVDLLDEEGLYRRDQVDARPDAASVRPD